MSTRLEELEAENVALASAVDDNYALLQEAHAENARLRSALEALVTAALEAAREVLGSERTSA